MLTWTAERGWHNGTVVPYGPLSVDPSLVGLHYGQVVFEGLKVLRQPDGGIAAFRAADYAHRFGDSARRLAMPTLPAGMFVAAVRELAIADDRWIPSDEGQSLYLRPTIYASEATLALRPAIEYTFLLVGFPTAPFFGSMLEPIDVWVSRKYSRAAPGGTGFAKCAGNYAASFLAQKEAEEHDCRQVLWLDSSEKRWVEEMGGMNVFWVTRSGVLVTPPLTDTILPGVTRDSVISIAGRLGIPVEERRMAIDDFCKQIDDGTIAEVFACGTASGITPVGRILSDNGASVIMQISGESLTSRLRDVLIGIQYGREPDFGNWLLRIQ